MSAHGFNHALEQIAHHRHLLSLDTAASDVSLISRKRPSYGSPAGLLIIRPHVRCHLSQVRGGATSRKNTSSDNGCSLVAAVPDACFELALFAETSGLSICRMIASLLIGRDSWLKERLSS